MMHFIIYSGYLLIAFGFDGLTRIACIVHSKESFIGKLQFSGTP